MPLLTKHSPFLLVFAIVAVASFSVQAADPNVERGKYLVTVMSCTDCHTPGALLGKPDTKRNLGGSEVGFALPDLGVFYGANLTPDKATGLGNWTIDEIAGAIRTGKHSDGRKLAPIMPVSSYRHLTPADALAIAAYLDRSLIRLSTSADEGSYDARRTA